MISLDLTKSSEVRIAGDRPNNLMKKIKKIKNFIGDTYLHLSTYTGLMACEGELQLVFGPLNVVGIRDGALAWFHQGTLPLPRRFTDLSFNPPLVSLSLTPILNNNKLQIFKIIQSNFL